MKLKSFKIQSYKSCFKTALKFDENLTCLIGINGSGKTNILNSIFLLKKITQLSLFDPSELTPDNQCSIEAEFEIDGKTLFIEGTIIYDINEQNEEIIFSYYLHWNYKDFINYSDWVHFPMSALEKFRIVDTKGNHIPFNPNNKKQITDRASSFASTLPEYLDDKMLKIISDINEQLFDFINGINYYSATCFADPPKCPVSFSFEDNRPIKNISSSRPHSKFIIDLFNLYKDNNSGYQRFVNLVNKSGIGLIDDISFTQVDLPSNTVENKSSKKIKVTNSHRFLMVPNFTIDGVNLSPNQLSEGTFKTLALIFYILNDDSKLLLIEEPEVCVHHGLLNSIIELIKSQSKDKQIIISTHSDYILDKLQPENIILVKRKEGKGTTAELLSKSMSKNDYKALKKYLNEAGNLGEYWKEGGFDDK